MKKLVYLALLLPGQAMAGGLSASTDSDMFVLLVGSLLLVFVFYMAQKIAEWKKPNPESEDLEEFKSENV